jgi:hypothetical protein
MKLFLAITLLAVSVFAQTATPNFYGDARLALAAEAGVPAMPEAADAPAAPPPAPVTPAQKKASRKAHWAKVGATVGGVAIVLVYLVLRVYAMGHS